LIAMNKHSLTKYFKFVFALLMLSTIISGCLNSKITESNYQVLKVPPNGIRVAQNFYCDATETSNLHWREYVYWNARVFGINSPEFIASLPDTLVWLRDLYCLEGYAENYFTHPAFNDYPAVGLTYQQALDYSKWRSDRVFEVLLIELNKIKQDTILNRKSYFTIEKYFDGTFEGILPGEKLKYYPEFRLPTTDERTIILHYSDSVEKANFTNCRCGYCRKHKSDYPWIHSDSAPCKKGSTKTETTLSIYGKCY